MNHHTASSGFQLSSAWMPLGPTAAVPRVGGPDPVAAVASTGKVAILAALAAAIDNGDLDPGEVLPIAPHHQVGGTGLLRHLSLRELSVEDLAVLTASVSDNIATNVILERLGLATVEDYLAGAAIPELAVLDRVRDQRDSRVAPAFAVGSARGLCTLMASVGTAEGLTPTARDMLLRWMRRNQDRAYVADVLDLDEPDLEVVNKTGVDAGVLADTGLVLGGSTDLAYAVVARWPDSTAAPRAAAASALRDVGAHLARVALDRTSQD